MTDYGSHIRFEIEMQALPSTQKRMIDERMTRIVELEVTYPNIDSLSYLHVKFEI